MGYVTETGSTVSIGLNEALSDSALLRTLAHELSHLNQKRYYAADLEHRLCPRDRVVWERLLEGEADARAARVIQAVNRRLSKDILPCDRGGLRVFNWLAGKLCSGRKMAALVFKNYQRSREAAGYDAEMWAWAQKVPLSKRLSLTDVFNDCADLFRNGKTLYLGAKNMPDLARKVSCYIPKFKGA